MSILSDLDQKLGEYGTIVVVLFAISVALPLVLGVLARMLVFRSDLESAGTQERAPGDPQPEFEHTGQFTRVQILTAKVGAGRGSSDNRGVGETPATES